MPVYTSEALILRTYKLGEADRIVVFLTRDRGKKRGVAKGARRPRVAVRGRARADDARGRGVLRERAARPGPDQLRRDDAVAARGAGCLGGAAEALGHVGYFAELIDEWAPEAQVDERLYRLGCSITDAIAAGAPVERLARYFEYWILRLQGVYPTLSACPGCGEPFADGAVMPAKDDLLVCRQCAPPAAARRSASMRCGSCRAAAQTAPDRLDALPLATRAARELETVHRRLLNLHLDKELKSARVLREMRHAR